MRVVEQGLALAREGVGRIVLPGLVLAVAVGVAAARVPDAFRAADARSEENARLSRLDRALVPARAVDIDVDTLLAARRVIPPSATYAVVAGKRVDVSTPVTLVALPQFLGYWLLPRRQATNPRAAGWILSYGGDLGALGLRYRRVVELKPGISFAEVQR